MIKMIHWPEKKRYAVGYYVFLLLSALSKESFILMIPATVLLQLWLYRKHNAGSWIAAFKANLGSVISFALFTILILIFIKKILGTSAIGYAGIDESITILNYYSTFEEYIRSRNFDVSIFLSLLISIGLTTVYVTTRKIDPFIKGQELVDLLLFLMVFVFLICIPQIILYTKSGLVGRYMVPISLSAALLILIPLNFVSRLFSSWQQQLILSTATIIISGLFLYSNFAYAVTTAYNFTESGKQSDAIISSLNMHVVSRDDQYVLIVIDPTEIPSFETSSSLKVLIHDYIHKSNPVYFQLIPADNQSVATLKGFQKDCFIMLNSWTEKNNIELIKDKSKISNILIFPGLEDQFLKGSGEWFAAARYNRVQGYHFIHYYEQ